MIFAFDSEDFVGLPELKSWLNREETLHFRILPAEEGELITARWTSVGPDGNKMWLSLRCDDKRKLLEAVPDYDRRRHAGENPPNTFYSTPGRKEMEDWCSPDEPQDTKHLINGKERQVAYHTF